MCSSDLTATRESDVSEKHTGGCQCGAVRYSIEGALGCLAACLLWALVVAEVSNVPLPVLLVGAVVATVVEVLPIPLDDNMGITLAAGYAMKLLAV